MEAPAAGMAAEAAVVMAAEAVVVVANAAVMMVAMVTEEEFRRFSGCGNGGLVVTELKIVAVALEVAETGKAV